MSWRKGQTAKQNEILKNAGQKGSKTRKRLFQIGYLIPWNKGLTKSTDSRINWIYPKSRKFSNLTDEQREKKRLLFTGDKNPNFNSNKTDFEKYGIECKFTFNLGDFPEEFNLYKIKHLFHPKNNKIGYTRDHMFSVYDGFKLTIPSKDIAHPANCILISHSDNSKKGKKSSITKAELYCKIEKWDSKYGSL